MKNWVWYIIFLIAMFSITAFAWSVKNSADIKRLQDVHQDKPVIMHEENAYQIIETYKGV